MSNGPSYHSLTMPRIPDAYLNEPDTASTVLLLRHVTWLLIGLSFVVGGLAYAIMTIEEHQTVLLRTFFFGSIARLLWTLIAVCGTPDPTGSRGLAKLTPHNLGRFRSSRA